MSNALVNTTIIAKVLEGYCKEIVIVRNISSCH